MEVVSLCPFRVASLIWQPRRGSWALTAVCKATYALQPVESQLAREQEYPNEDDNHWNDDPARSLHSPSDLVPFKPRADVMLVGHAFAPRKEPARSVVARVIVGDVDKAIEVFGERTWTQDRQLREGPRFVKMPLRWERASGGPDTQNPVGMRVDARPDPYGNVPVPNLQPPGKLVSDAGDFIEPVGFGPIAASWPMRRDKLGRSAASWSSSWSEQPLPDDIDPGFFNAAPRDQQVESIRPNERIVLENLHPEHARLVTNLPGVGPRAFVERRGAAPQELAMTCDTLWIDTDRGVCTLTWRGQIPLEHPGQPGRVLIAMAEAGQRLTWADVERIVGASQAELTETDAVPRAEPRQRESVEPPQPTSGFERDPKMPLKAATLPFVSSAMLSPAPPPEAPPPPIARRGDALTDTHDEPGGLPAIAPGAALPFGASAAPAPVFNAPATPPPPPAPPPGLPPPLPAPSRMRPKTEPAPSRADASPSWLPQQRTALPAPPPPPPRAPSFGAPPPPIALPPMAPPPIAPAPLATPIAPPPIAPPPIAPPPIAPPPVAPPAGDVPWAASAPKPLETSLGLGTGTSAAGGLGLGSTSLGAAASEGLGGGLGSTLGLGGTPVPSARASTARGPAPREIVDLLWFEPRALAGVRAHPEWRKIHEEIRAKRPETRGADPRFDGDHGAAREPPEAADRRDVISVLVRGDAIDAEGIDEAIAGAADDDGAFTPPLVLIGGELLFPFDGQETLEATVTERTLLEQRRYQKRTVFGEAWLRALLTPPASSSPIPAYLPEPLGKRLPMFQRLRVKLIAEVHLQQDQYEAHPSALKVVAIGRVMPLAGRGRA